jgi:flavin-binding protein dodecin
LVTKIIKLIGKSTKSWEAAAEDAIIEASKTIRNIKRFYVDKLIGVVNKEGKIGLYKTSITLAFNIESER